MLSKVVYQLSPIESLEGFSGRAEFSASEGILSAGFEGVEDSYVVRFELPEAQLADGVSVRLFLQGWQEIRYAAVGYTGVNGFHHIKASNIRQDAWVDFGFTHQDLIWRIQNGAESGHKTTISDIRVFIKGVPSEDGGAVLKLSSLTVQRANEPSQLPKCALDSRLMWTVRSYLLKSFRDYEGNARTFMESGKCAMPGERLLEWSPEAPRPEGLEAVNTYRFAWHGQHPAINLLLYSEQSGAAGPAIAARTLIDNWLDQSYYRVDEDARFAWYDHGTAERLLSFILMWAKAVEFGFDERFFQRLGEAITSHARLLNSEAFYAFNQPSRYHNHAWFQDAALAAAALAFPGLPESKDWLENAISRFEDQLDKLIVRDGGFAIFVENSIGYHHGVQRLAEFVGSLVELTDQPTEIPTIANELVAWSDFLRYPDGRVPAQGDTFRLPPRTAKDIRRGNPWDDPGCTVLPRAGYAVVKGNHEGKPWMLCLFNTSISPTHKHEDNLSITLWFDGIEWITDPSFFSHEYSREEPAFLRSSSAHSTVYLDEIRYEPAFQSSISLEPIAEGYMLSAYHNAYGPVCLNRKIIGKSEELLFRIEDSGFQGEHGPVKVGFQIPNHISIESDSESYTLSSPNSAYRLSIFSANNRGRSRVAASISGLTFMSLEECQRIVFEPDLESASNLVVEIKVLESSREFSLGVSE